MFDSRLNNASFFLFVILLIFNGFLLVYINDLIYKEQIFQNENFYKKSSNIYSYCIKKNKTEAWWISAVI